MDECDILLLERKPHIIPVTAVRQYEWCVCRYEVTHTTHDQISRISSPLRVQYQVVLQILHNTFVRILKCVGSDFFSSFIINLLFSYLLGAVHFADASATFLRAGRDSPWLLFSPFSLFPGSMPLIYRTCRIEQVRVYSY